VGGHLFQNDQVDVFFSVLSEKVEMNCEVSEGRSAAGENFLLFSLKQMAGGGGSCSTIARKRTDCVLLRNRTPEKNKKDAD